MEKAVLKTLIYADIFNYPLKAWEIHKWLISNSASLQQVEKALERLSVKGKAERVKDYFCLAGRKNLIKIRAQKEKQAKKLFLKANILSWFLKIVPTVKLVGISGGLALNNASSSDDIDLFLITDKGKIWTSRILVILILDLLGARRKAMMTKSEAAGKICTNILIEEDKLEQTNKDLFTSHEVLQMKVLWQRGNTYSKYLSDNEWVFKFLPNWITGRGIMIKDERLRSKGIKNHKSILDHFESLAKWFQLKIMQKPKGMERIEEGALYFHPNDIRLKILNEYKNKTKFFSTS